MPDDARLQDYGVRMFLIKHYDAVIQELTRQHNQTMRILRERVQELLNDDFGSPPSELARLASGIHSRSAGVKQPESASAVNPSSLSAIVPEEKPDAR